MYFLDKHKTITLYYEMSLKTVCDKYDLKRMECDILMFLHEYPELNTASDIIKFKKLTKSHVSTSLKILKNRGLITKKYEDNNNKTIRIYLKESANPIINDGLEVRKQFALDLLNGLTNEEKENLKNAFFKVCQNAEDCIKKKSNLKNDN